ncbi:hypothetical protein BX600DRAFT_549465 [Xylariales sp. PMI_506]|nr:hypothetical protein BX600DRAFT_549465 [Xylariales sp. PMI_506]
MGERDRSGQITNDLSGQTYYDTTAGLLRSLDYDFVSELAPNVWKVIHSPDGVACLACDATKELQNEDGTPTSLRQLLDPCGQAIIEQLLRILNHENLVNLVDWIQVKDKLNPGSGMKRLKHYLLWDFCNAGTLENLLMPRNELGWQGINETGSPHDRSEDGTSRTSKIFLPEGFCWHVLCSLLKCLAWLHHGLREEYDTQTGDYELVRVDFDWHTILHRSISPSNIFFCDPQTKHETYGLCKLGNFSQAFVSGHFNGIIGGRVPPANGKVLAGRDIFIPLSQLRCWDDGDINRSPVGKPYTILCEYKSIGDIMLSMMNEPLEALQGVDHFSDIQARAQDRWNELVVNTGYTNSLKRLVCRLFAKDNAEHLASYNLYKTAQQAYREFLVTEPECQLISHVHQLQAAQQAKRLGDEATLQKITEQAGRVLDDQDRIRKKRREESTTSTDDILTEISKACKAIGAGVWDGDMVGH